MKTIAYEDSTLVVSDIYPTTALDVRKGYFYRLDASGSPVRRVLSDDDGFVVVYLADAKKTKRRPLRLAWEIINNTTVPQDHEVYAKNLNSNDYSGFNLQLIHKNEFKQLKDAIKNLEGALKLKPTENKPHGVTLMYILGGRKQKEYFEDIVTAKKAKNKILVYCTKLVSKYTITE